MRRDSPYYIPSIRALQSASLFRGVDEEMMEEILSHFIPMTLPKKSVIASWQTVESFFVIIGGRVKVSRIDPETGREYTVFLLSRGDAFDVISLLEGKEHDVTIEAVDELQLLKTSMKTARDWLDRHPEFNKNFLPYLGKKMHALEDAAADLALLDTTTRLARLILHHVDAKSDGPAERYAVRLIDDLSHETLAQMIGSVRKVVNLDIQKLKKENIIEASRGKLLVKDLQALAQKAKTVLPTLRKEA
jgi:CRP-like cAMP-binding protein